jgi:exodeoxyribonuclease V
MIEKFLYQQIRTHFSYTPTADQEILLSKLCQFTANRENDIVMLIKGYAGTGKTSMISSYVNALKQLKLKFILLAPTGRAAKILSYYSGHPAFTIHKQIYRQNTNKADFSDFGLGFNPHKDTIFIVDEASMISNEYLPSAKFGSGRLLDDLLKYVYNQNNCRMILIGDTAQLPPVNTTSSPALEPDEFSQRGFRVVTTELTMVIRQAEHSGILMNATYLRNQVFEESKTHPIFRLNDYEDIISIRGSELIDSLETEYNHFGIEEVKVICRSNKQANIFNRGIRNQILWREEEISQGDILMVVKNNYFWLPEDSPISFIANGDMLEIIRVKKHLEMYGYHFLDCLIRFIDYPELEIEVRLLTESLSSEVASMPSEEMSEFYANVEQDYTHITNQKKRFEAIRKDPFFNAIQVKYAYALTCHKSQGGQWKCIFIDQGYVTKEMFGNSYYRWLYTAITRATEKLYLVNFPETYFKDTNS